MKVKKLFWAALTVMCAMTMTMTFTACGGDDDNSDTPSKSEIKGISGRYLISVDEKMAELCDYTMTYYGNNNKLTSEQATWTVKDGTATWTKDVNSTQLPATFGVKINIKIKEGAQLEGVKISNIHPITKLLYAEGIASNGQKAWDKTIDLGGGASSHTGSTGEKLPSYIELWEERGGMLNYSYTLDKDGNLLDSKKIE